MHLHRSRSCSARILGLISFTKKYGVARATTPAPQRWNWNLRHSFRSPVSGSTSQPPVSLDKLIALIRQLILYATH